MEVQVEWSGYCKMSVLLLFCLLLFSDSQIAAARVQRPGFLYTRTRGRCTPQFWSGRRETWPRMVPETSTVWKVFGSRTYERYSWDLTLAEATARNDEGNAFGRLVKEASAALLNSYTREGYPYRPWQVKTLLIQALVSEGAASSQAKRFLSANLACH
ncbi:hypothetical protein K1719_006656 [Acacia pycnantha]|nr:hypothetical protein K1719_006656 [Acacia pycnantha]